MKYVDPIKHLRNNGLNVDCSDCGEPVSKRIINYRHTPEGLCPDCSKRYALLKRMGKCT